MRGMSLLEVVAALGLFALLGTMAARVMVPVLGLWQSEQGRNAAVEAACSAETTVIADLQEASAASLSVATPPESFSLLLPGPGPACDPTTGAPQWGTLVLWSYEATTGTLWRRCWTAGLVPAAPIGLPTVASTPLPVAALTGLPAPSVRRMASGLSDFSLMPAGGRLAALHVAVAGVAHDVTVRMGR
ncbi:MAG: PulJ/GspJ family protein [Candidatus Xenobia bacterium]